jgi:hypothetical protein
MGKDLVKQKNLRIDFFSPGSTGLVLAGQALYLRVS